MAPTTAKGRFLSAPNAAAAKAMMTTLLRVAGSSPNSGAMRIPPKAPNMDPSAHEVDDTRLGRAPLRAANSRLSTTALMAVPIRIRRNRYRMEIAMAMATTNTISRCQGSRDGPRSTPFSIPKRNGTRRAVSASQITPTSASNNTMTATVTMSCTTRVAVLKRRINKMSRNTPNAGANNPTTTSRASMECQSRFTCSSQYRKAEKTPMAPWAKLNPPVVV